MALSRQEIEAVINKLRGRYDEYSKKFSPVWFNRKDFEDRLLMSINNRMDLEGFILAEISNFEKIRERYEQKMTVAPKFSEKVDRIIDENLARIKKYPFIQIHRLAWIEISHCYGAMNDFAMHYLPIFSILFEDEALKKSHIEFEQKLSYLAMTRGNKHPKRIEDHAMLLQRKSLLKIEIERDKNEYLKESAFLLHAICDFCGDCLELRNKGLENPLRLNRLYIEEKRKKRIIALFRDCTGYGAIMRVSDQANAIIDDFRLRSFKPRIS
jgi:hypothetical protein